jgi:hypothetical protein
MITDYHAKYFAYELTKRHPSDSLEKLAGAVASAQVDLKLAQLSDEGGPNRTLFVLCTAFRAKRDQCPNLT